MDNYLANFDGKDPAPKQKRRGVGFLMFVMACLICAVVSAGVSWAVCSQQLAQAGPTVSNVPDDQPVNAETPILNLNSTALTKGRSDEGRMFRRRWYSSATFKMCGLSALITGIARAACKLRRWLSARAAALFIPMTVTSSPIIMWFRERNA